MSELKPFGGEEGAGLAPGIDALAAQAGALATKRDFGGVEREGVDTAMEDATNGGPRSPFASYRGKVDVAASSSLAPTASGSSTQSDMAPAPAQPRRPVTPPRKSSPAPSSGSSSDTITVATQKATLSPAKSKFKLTQTDDIADESPDPLRIVPVPSASSAARSTASRARSASAEPFTDRLQSSPTTNYRRQRSKTPVTVDRTGENLDPRTVSRASSVSLGGAGKLRAMGMLAEDDESDDELAIVPAASAMRRNGSTSNSVFVGVEVPVGRSSASMSRNASASSVSHIGPAASPAQGPAAGVTSGRADTQKKGKGRVEHNFELVIEQPVRVFFRWTLRMSLTLSLFAGST